MDFLFDFISTHILSLLLIIITIIIFLSFFLIMGFRYPYQSAKNHGFLIACIAFVIAIIYDVEKYAHFKEFKNWIGIADNILSGSIFAIIYFTFSRFERKIKNHYEDAEKLRQDYDALSQKYIKDNLVKVVNKNGSIVCYCNRL